MPGTFTVGTFVAMLSPIAGQITFGVYALLLAVGGVIGYAKAASKPSLIAGLASALAAIIALVLSFQNTRWGMGLGAAVALLLFFFFGYRYAVKTRKFMPAGLLAVVSLAVLAVAIMVLR
jgi:uncharacterized membrane protein (UPF0136 family)